MVRLSGYNSVNDGEAILGLLASSNAVSELDILRQQSHWHYTLLGMFSKAKKSVDAFQTSLLPGRQIIAGNARLGSAVRKTMRHMKEKLPREPGIQPYWLKDRRAKLCVKK